MTKVGTKSKQQPEKPYRRFKQSYLSGTVSSNAQVIVAEVAAPTRYILMKQA